MSRRLASRDDRRDRAQLLLVGALTLAVVFLSLSLLLNSVIYTENLATRQTGADVDRATTFRHDVVAGLGDAIEHVNGGDAPDAATRRSEYRTVTDAWLSKLANYSATNGLAGDVERRTVSEGTRIADGNDSTTLTPQNGNTTWTVVTDAKVRNFHLRIDGASLSGDVIVRIDDGTTRTLRIEDTAPKPQLRVVGAADPTCTLSDGRIDVSGGQVGGRDCPALRSVDLSDEVDITIEDGAKVNGTYSLVADRREAGMRAAVDTRNHPNQCAPPSPPTYNDSDAADPYSSPAIYAATADVSVRTQDLDYARTVRVAPGEHGAPPTEPTFVKYDVTPTGAGSPSSGT
ncbi:hypothetical protein ACFQL0_08235 [Haloplanus litoreus]|uniref:DUF7261 family protein n=1 Tax=Haloplanus litoreus TaxID=767515 RepID=UPI0036231513